MHDLLIPVTSCNNIMYSNACGADGNGQQFTIVLRTIYSCHNHHRSHGGKASGGLVVMVGVGGTV